MKLLAFDTATEWCTVALRLGEREDECVAREVHAGQKHSDLLVPMVMDLLAEAGLSLRGLDGLAYGMGPGSFTGLRIACGVAQGLALGADLPVLGVSTLEALAEEARDRHGVDRVVACLDARMNEVYAGLYRHDGASWRPQAGPVVCPPAAAPLPETGRYLGVGSGFGAYAALEAHYAGCLAGVDTSLIPHARAVVRLAAPRFARGEGVSAEAAEPLYIRDKVALKIRER